MKSKFLTILSVLVVAVMMLTLASCTSDANHTHTFSNDWTVDDANHWHAASCTAGDACKTATSDKAAHTFVDGKCSVCEHADPDYVAPVVPSVLNGDTQTVNATADGALYTFTAKMNNTYVLTWTDANAKVLVNGAEIATGYEFSLDAGEAITFAFATASGADAAYDVTVAVYEEPTPANVLTGGTQTVNATYMGVAYTFTAKVDNTYVITWTHGNAYIMAETAPNMTEEISSGYEFTLASGESITIVMCTNDGDDSYDVTIDVKEEETTVLTGGTQTVNATYMGVAYTFTAKLDGTYVITWTHGNAYIMAETAPNMTEEISSGYEFTLASGESITIVMCTNSGDDTYDVTIDMAQ